MISTPHHFYSSYQIKKSAMDGSCGTHGTQVRTGFWWEKPEGKRSLGCRGYMREYNIRMDVQEIGQKGVDCIDLT